MPSGTYAVLGEDGRPVGTEAFRCAPGPIGWRYVSDIHIADPVEHDETVDVAVDDDWRPVRAVVRTGDHEAWLEATGDHLTGVRDGEPVELPWGPDHHLDYYTPATNLITTRRLDGTTEIDVVYLDPITIEPSMARQRYELLGDEEVETPVGWFDAVRWRFTALDSGWSGHLWVAGDVVVAYEGLFDLTAYEPGATGPVPRR
jgi:hypothetical protein